MELIRNKTAHRDYEIIHKYQAGIQLEGREVKSLRLKNGSLKEAHVRVISGEAFLLNAQINPYSFAPNDEYEPKRTRKLLLHKKEITQLATATTQKRLTVIPLSFELIGNTIKLNIAIARGKKEHEKRAKLKERAIKRDVDRQLKQKIRLR